MNGRHSEWPPWRNAINITGGLGGIVLWRRRLWARLSVFRPNLEIPHQSARGVFYLEAPLCLIFIGYHWVSSDLSRKVEKRSNCEIGSNIMGVRFRQAI